ncbi:6-bladed beta-propeller [Gemmatimonadota bacterium]
MRKRRHLWSIYSLLISMVTALSGCSPDRDSPGLHEAELLPLWSVQPADTDSEPWFGEIADVAVDAHSVYIADRSRRTIIVLDADGHHVRKIGRSGSGPGEFGILRRVSVSPSGSIYVVSGGYSTISKFDAGGQFVDRRDHSQLVSEDLQASLALPLVLDDSTFVYQLSPHPWRSQEEQLAIPPLLRVRPTGIDALGERSLSKPVQAAIGSFPQVSGFAYVEPFTIGEVCPGPGRGETLFVRSVDPYTVYRFDEHGSSSTFTFWNVERDEIHDWIELIEMPYEEWRESIRATDPRYLGEWPILQEEIPPKVHRSFSFRHTLRGLARNNGRLAILAESVTEDFRQGVPGSGLERFVYVVDLTEEKATARAPVNAPGSFQLEGMLDDGSLILSTNDPVPGVFAFRLIHQ